MGELLSLDQRVAGQICSLLSYSAYSRDIAGAKDEANFWKYSWSLASLQDTSLHALSYLL